MSELLFASHDLRSLLENLERKLLDEIDGVDPDRLLNTSEDEWVHYFVSECTVDVPVLDEEGITVEQEDTKVDVSQDRNRVIHDRGRPFYRPGTTITFHVPFTGDAALFRCRASSFTLNPPQAVVGNNELRISFQRTDPSPGIRSEFDRELAAIQEHLRYVAGDANPFNAALEDKVRRALAARREKLLRDRGVVASLGFPLRERPDEARTYVTPAVRKKVSPPRPPVGTPPFTPEPALSMDDYDHILRVVTGMVMVMERSPAAFRTMGEEALRQHFLVQLNGQYEGQATGETFNFEGKTDILIRVDDRNIFIAECKFWKGPKAFAKTIDQLLGYATWRDTKTAIFLFNRSKNLSAVLEKIPGVVEQHPSFKRRGAYESETGFRFVLHHRDDPSRELILTVVVFEVPA